MKGEKKKSHKFNLLASHNAFSTSFSLSLSLEDSLEDTLLGLIHMLFKYSASKEYVCSLRGRWKGSEGMREDNRKANSNFAAQEFHE